MDIFFTPPDTTLAADGEKAIEKASEALPKLGQALAEPMKHFWEGFSSAGNAPSDVTIDFNLLFEGSAGWAIVSARTQASLRVTLKWSDDKG